MADKKSDIDDTKKKKPKDVDVKESKANGDDDGEGDKTRKSQDLIDELKKSRQNLLDGLNERDPALRKAMLLEKAGNGQISEEDNRELIAYLQGKSLDEALSDRVNKSFSKSDSLKKSTDASPFLADLHKSNLESHQTLAKAVENGLSLFNETAFAMASNLALLTKSHVAIMEQVSDLQKSHEAVLAQPVGAPRSQGIQAAERPVGNAVAPALDKSKVKTALHNMFAKSRTGSTEQMMYGNAMSAFDVHGTVSPAIMADIEKYLGAAN